MSYSPRTLVVPLIRWVGIGGLAILEQALFAGSHFVTNILLARWVEPEQYGAFALGYAVFLLLGSLQMAVVTEPMMILGSKKSSEKRAEYVSLLLHGQLILMTPLLLAFFAFFLLVTYTFSVNLTSILAGLAFAAPVLLIMWMLRKALYLIRGPAWAAAGGCLYMVLLISFLCLLRISESLSGQTAFLGMGVSAVAVILLFLAILHPQWFASRDGYLALAKVHWHYGRWALGTAALVWAPTYIYFLILPAWVDLEGAAALRAILNLALPLTHVASALSVLLLPVLCRRLQESFAKLKEAMSVSFCFFVITGVIYLSVLVVLSKEFLSFLYGPKYLLLAHIVPLAGVFALFNSLGTVFGNGLRAMERPDKVFWSYVATSVFGIPLGILLMAKLGVTGAMCGMVLSSLVLATFLAYSFYQCSPQRAVPIRIPLPSADNTASS